VRKFSMMYPSTTTESGLKEKCRLDRRKYRIRIIVTEE
jgi:hypothetical protein